MDIVLDERSLELAWEEYRKYDLYRNKRNLKRDYPGIHLTGKDANSKVAWDSKQIVEYTPESQILVHDGLIQNP